MDAVILDVGGVLLVPHEEPVNLALSFFGIALDGAQAERAHYFGVHAMDLADDEPAARLAYLVGFAEAAGIPAASIDAAVERMRDCVGNLSRLQVALQLKDVIAHILDVAMLLF